MSATLELFADVAPIDQDEGPVAVVSIDYAPAFSQVMGYFRRVLVNGEHSERALALSAGVCELRCASHLVVDIP